MKKYFLALSILSLFISAKAQIVNIPDTNFKKILLNYSVKIDSNDDKEIQITEAAQVKILHLESKKIHDLTGLEFFTSLEQLWCWYNSITSIDVHTLPNLAVLSCSWNLLSTLDVTHNAKLSLLDCRFNALHEINVSENPDLYTLTCNNNFFTSIDVSTNTKLNTLQCYNNMLTAIDVRNNPDLDALYCHDNLITSLDIRNNAKLLHMNCNNNPSLSEICLTTQQSWYVSDNLWQKDIATTCNTNCPLGIENNFAQNRFEAYPNPASENTVLKISSSENEKGVMEIYDLLGQKIFTENVILAQGQNQIPLSTNELSNGVYVLQLHSASLKSAVSLVIQR